MLFKQRFPDCDEAFLVASLGRKAGRLRLDKVVAIAPPLIPKVAGVGRQTHNFGPIRSPAQG